MKYTYIDIGTCDFETSAELMVSTDFGLFVEPLFKYLKKIPEEDNIIKAPFAISNFKGYSELFYFSEENINYYNLPNWVRGCNSIGKPHKLLSIEFPFIVPNKLFVPTITFSDLIELYSITEAQNIKIDTEGHDHIILNQIINYVQSLNIKKIIFEYIPFNGNTNELNNLILNFNELGFKNYFEGDNCYLINK